MTDTDRDRIEQLAEAIGECLATIAALREELDEDLDDAMPTNSVVSLDLEVIE